MLQLEQKTHARLVTCEMSHVLISPYVRRALPESVHHASRAVSSAAWSANTCPPDGEASTGGASWRSSSAMSGTCIIPRVGHARMSLVAARTG